MILLRRKIEHRWYQGECNGVLGVFPLTYVQVGSRYSTCECFLECGLTNDYFSFIQVVVPLSSHSPQCKALYDFGKCHEDDDGCLHFSKVRLFSYYVFIF